MQGEIKDLGSFVAIEYLLNLDGLALSKNIDSIRESTSNHFSSKVLFLNTISLLSEMGYLEISERKASKTKQFDKSTFIQDFITYLHKQELLNKVISTNNLIFDTEKEQYFVCNNSVSLKYSPIRNFLINANFFSLSPLKGRLYINSNFQELARKAIFPLIEREYITKGLSPEQLKLRQLKNEKNGLEAERFVIEFEKKRLSSHIRVSDIQHVALSNVSAGFDILSFSSSESHILDREIEVKSYIEDVHFFLSKNEYQKAKQSKNKYLIYLVNRSKIKDKNYQPEIIQNPINFLEKSKEWKCEIEGYHFKKVNLNT